MDTELIIECTPERHEILLDGFHFNLFTWSDKKIKDAVKRERKKFTDAWDRLYTEVCSHNIHFRQGNLQYPFFYSTYSGTLFFSFVAIKCNVPYVYTLTFKRGNFVVQHKISGLMFIHSDADTLIDMIKNCIERLNRGGK